MESHCPYAANQLQGLERPAKGGKVASSPDSNRGVGPAQFMYFVYIIQNHRNRLYIGHTQDLEKRLLGHNNNRSPFTKNKGPGL